MSLFELLQVVGLAAALVLLAGSLGGALVDLVFMALERLSRGADRG